MKGFVLPDRSSGFSLVELLVSVAITLAVSAGIFAVLNPAGSTFQSQPEESDMQQRLRVSVDAMYRDLLMAGAGAYLGSSAGPLVNFFAPVLPFRQGLINADVPGTFTSNKITVLYVPVTASQTTITDWTAAQAAMVSVNAESGCPSGDESCGFREGMNVLIYDARGFYDTYTIAAATGAALSLRHDQNDSARSYAPGSKIVQIASRTYWLNTATNQLMRYDGDLNDTAIADNVVSLAFEYYGEAKPPLLRKMSKTKKAKSSDLSEPEEPGKPDVDLRISYGPQPPAFDKSIAGWPNGENCVIQVVEHEQVPRLAAFSGDPGLVRLDSTVLSDGPWCPDAGSPNRWDADLLRVRRIVATVRVQSAVAALRGSSASLFKRAGSGGRSNQLLPDQEIRFDVTPRNLNLRR